MDIAIIVVLTMLVGYWAGWIGGKAYMEMREWEQEDDRVDD